MKVTGEKPQTIRFQNCIIATGSLPAVPKPWQLGDDRVMDSTGALLLPDVPKTLLVIGGGYIGLEIGSVYAALGHARSRWSRPWTASCRWPTATSSRRWRRSCGPSSRRST